MINHPPGNPMDPAMRLELMIVSGVHYSSIAEVMMDEYGVGRAASALAMLTLVSPYSGVRGLGHLASLGAPLGGILHRLEAINVSPWSLIGSEHVPVEARIRIAEAIQGGLGGVVSEAGIKITDATMESLDDGMIVDGSLSLYRVSGLRRIPDRLSVADVLDIWACPHLVALGRQLNVGSLLRVRETIILDWPKDIAINRIDVADQT